MESWRTLAERCQKPDFRRVGHWLARWVARPLALRATWWVLPLGLSANTVTTAALVVGLAAATWLGSGTRAGLAGGVILLHVWYLLDHVDGQVARYRGAACLTGRFFDYLMHYTVHAAMAFGLGYGCAAQAADLRWTVAAAAWALGTVVLGLQWDCRYKAWFDSIEDRHGLPGGVRSNTPPRRPGSPDLPDPNRHAWFRRLFRLSQYAVEVPTVLCTLPGLAIWVCAVPAAGWPVLRGYVLVMAVLTLLIGAAKSGRVIVQRRVDREYESWFGAPGLG